MGKFDDAIKKLEEMIEVGGTLEDADDVLESFKELNARYEALCEIYAESIANEI